ncbi:hypothetical protein [Rhodovulum euryhalinum]|uniref:Uncharacterized protein n=1 Tax=Rhodovulum euryhalinum TaxID=35805 RepID=A0A4R2KA84_9RHOB|nr:hypothetical protein [Rhodovulum euryhalinum]TCO70371.1 hypothetical protein EV655_110137 [Rhodovulum euryhalinum]
MATCRECGKVLGLFGSNANALCENCALILEAEQMFHEIKALEDQGLSREEITAAVWKRDKRAEG